MTATGGRAPEPPHVGRAARPGQSRRAQTAARARARAAARRSRRRRRLVLLVVVPVLVIAGAVAAAMALNPTRGTAPALADGRGVAATPTMTATAPTPTPTPTPTGPTFTAAELDDPSGDLVVVNKQRPFEPKAWKPAHLVEVAGPNELMRPEAAKALAKLFTAAAKAGHPLVVHSAYRSYPVQASTYEGWVAQFGKKSADTQSARPGYSEHQSGLAVDVLPQTGSCHALGCFASTKQATWLAANAWRYGFVVRYPKGQQDVTGYIWEPWHIRYVGTDVSRGMHDAHQSVLETYVGLPAAPDY